MNVTRAATRGTRLLQKLPANPALPRTQVRHSSDGPLDRELAYKTGIWWRNVSMIGAIPLVIVGITALSVPHEHVEEPPQYPHLKRWVKPFPFKDGNTNLFRMEDEHH